MFDIVEPLWKKHKSENKKNFTFLGVVSEYFRRSTNLITGYAKRTKDLIVKTIRKVDHNPVAVNKALDRSLTSNCCYGTFKTLATISPDTRVYLSSSTYAKSNMLTESRGDDGSIATVP